MLLSFWECVSVFLSDWHGMRNRHFLSKFYQNPLWSSLSHLAPKSGATSSETMACLTFFFRAKEFQASLFGPIPETDSNWRKSSFRILTKSIEWKLIFSYMEVCFNTHSFSPWKFQKVSEVHTKDEKKWLQWKESRRSETETGTPRISSIIPEGKTALLCCVFSRNKISLFCHLNVTRNRFLSRYEAVQGWQEVFSGSSFLRNVGIISDLFVFLWMYLIKISGEMFGTCGFSPEQTSALVEELIVAQMRNRGRNGACCGRRKYLAGRDSKRIWVSLQRNRIVLGLVPLCSMHCIEGGFS